MSEDGCWIVLSDNANLLRVELDEISELTSTEWKGKELTVTGRLQRKVVLPSGKGYKDYERVCKENNTKPGLEPIVLMKALRIDMTE